MNKLLYLASRLTLAVGELNRTDPIPFVSPNCLKFNANIDNPLLVSINHSKGNFVLNPLIRLLNQSKWLAQLASVLL